jgi:hypothetical protein
LGRASQWNMLLYFVAIWSFYGHLVYFAAFGLFFTVMVHFWQFWCVLLRKIWQPCLKRLTGTVQLNLERVSLLLRLSIFFPLQRRVVSPERSQLPCVRPFSAARPAPSCRSGASDSRGRAKNFGGCVFELWQQTAGWRSFTITFLTEGQFAKKLTSRTCAISPDERCKSQLTWPACT